MYVEQIIFPIESLGPGKRVGIWLIGCNRHCPGCSNPELWSHEGQPQVGVDSVAELVQSIFLQERVDGITISGGEPMEQAEELSQLVDILSLLTDDILVYSGYTYQEILKDAAKKRVLYSIAVLVDGEYIEEKNTGLILRGSSNQHIYLFHPSLEEKYKAYLSDANPNTVQNMYFDDSAVSFGIHHPNFSGELDERLREKGVTRKDESHEMA